MCETKENKKACLKCEVEEAKMTFKKSMQDNNYNLCKMFSELFKKYEYESSSSNRA